MLAQIGDDRLTSAWVWDGKDVDVRYGFYRILETLEAAASAIRLNLEHDPALVPLETIAGRNHHQFPAGEQPPWRWRVPSVYPG